MSNRSRGWLTLALVAGVLAGCESATGPADREAFNADAALADYKAFDSILASEGLRGFRAMGRNLGSGTLGQGAGLVVASAAELEVFRSAGDARSFAALLVGASEPLHAASGPIISVLHRGKTFVYDAELDCYVVAPDRTGAPPTGVRFIMYAEVLGKPDPSREIGFADLIDEGDNSAEDIALHLVVVEGEKTVLDYRVTLDEQNGNGAITVEGLIRGDDDQLDFEIDVQGSNAVGGSTLDVAFHMAVANRGFDILGTVLGTKLGESETGDVDVTVRHGTESLRVDLSGTETTVTGTVFLKDTPFAVVSGDSSAPVFTRPDGEDLTQLEVLVLLRVVDIVEDAFDLFEDLMDPIDELVLLAVIL